MPHWTTELLGLLDAIDRHVGLAILLFLATLFGGSAIAAAVLIRLPPDYCRAGRSRPSRQASRSIPAWTGIAAKNVVGALLVAVGAFLSLPGVPGQGLLTVLAGLMLLDFPGKHRLVCRLLARPALLHPVNRLRARFARAPLVVGCAPPASRPGVEPLPVCPRGARHVQSDTSG